MKLELSKNVVDQKNHLQLSFGLLGKFTSCITNLLIVEWRMGIQLT